MQQGNGKALVNIPSHVIMASTDTAGTSVLLPSLCVADDRIDPKPADIADGSTTAMVEIILMSVAGFRIDRNRDSALAYIRGDGTCTAPDSNSLNGSVVYTFRNGNRNDSCACMSKSSVVTAGIALPAAGAGKLI